eukprot:s3666_g6.t1
MVCQGSRIRHRILPNHFPPPMSRHRLMTRCLQQCRPHQLCLLLSLASATRRWPRQVRDDWSRWAATSSGPRS